MYYAIINQGEHNGRIIQMDENDIWTGDNPNGWTYQGICGPHGQVLAENEDRSKVEATLNEWLKCDSVETGHYCYTHNPKPQ